VPICSGIPDPQSEIQPSGKSQAEKSHRWALFFPPEYSSEVKKFLLIGQSREISWFFLVGVVGYCQSEKFSLMAF
jgi:hypothetical protein